jgi:tetratricopeptide (TPR) repeat protein
MRDDDNPIRESSNEIEESTDSKPQNSSETDENSQPTDVNGKSRYERYLKWRDRNINWIGPLGIVSGIVAFVVTIISFIPSLTGKPLIPRPIEKMSGEFNIAVAIFTDQDGRESEYGNDVASVFSNRLKTGLNDFTQKSQIIQVVEVLEPNATGPIRGDSPDVRTENALSLANNIGAHMIVFGTIEQRGNDIYIFPQFAISYQFITDVEEVLGQYRFGSPILIKDSAENLQDRLLFNKEMTDRTNALASITVGLINYFSGNYQDAIRFFTMADGYESWGTNEGKEVIKILLGNAFIKSGEFDQAIESYQKAIEINDEYSRGYIGLATAEFRKAISKPQEIDYSLVYDSVSDFNRATTASDKPTKSLVDLKALFGLGEARLLLSQAGKENQLNGARSAFQGVINRFNGLDEEDIAKKVVWERAAQSYAHLGLIAYIQKLPMSEVMDYYQKASDSAVEYKDPNLAALYWQKLSALFEEQADYAGAINAIENGLKVVEDQQISEELKIRKHELLMKSREIK